jgi:hypothetical protein
MSDEKEKEKQPCYCPQIIFFDMMIFVVPNPIDDILISWFLIDCENSIDSTTREFVSTRHYFILLLIWFEKLLQQTPSNVQQDET